MKARTFYSNVEIVGPFHPTGMGITDDVLIKNEPMFFNCSYEFALKNGGQITKSFLTALPYEWRKDVVVDSRVHMLMKGWYPCIPGWHHDDVPRGDNGQPNYDNPEYRSEHIMGLINGDIAPTNFLVGVCPMPEVPKDKVVYKVYNDACEKLIADNTLVRVVTAPSNTLIYFDCDTFHTGVKAVKDGWRWFIRVSCNTNRVNKITNEFRKQVQIYMEDPTQGW